MIRHVVRGLKTLLPEGRRYRKIARGRPKVVSWLGLPECSLAAATEPKPLIKPVWVRDPVQLPELPEAVAPSAVKIAVPIGEPSPVQASHPGPAENEPLLPEVMS